MKGYLAALLSAFLILCSAASSAQTKTLSVDEVIRNGEQYAGRTVTVRGLCTHLCSHGGRKMFLKGPQSAPLRVESSKATGAFPEKAVNAIVLVSGRLCESRIDESYLLEWEERNGKSSSEHEGCETESAARGERGNTVKEKIASFRARIAERKEKEGKAYLSTFYIEATSYKIL